MKVKRRKFNIFEQMEIAVQDPTASGPVEEFVLTPAEFEEFKVDARNKPHTSFKKITGRPGDLVGGDWSYRGAIITVSGKPKD
jgi:hypothetical protein